MRPALFWITRAFSKKLAASSARCLVMEVADPPTPRRWLTTIDPLSSRRRTMPVMSSVRAPEIFAIKSSSTSMPPPVATVAMNKTSILRRRILASSANKTAACSSSATAKASSSPADNVSTRTSTRKSSLREMHRLRKKSPSIRKTLARRKVRRVIQLLHPASPRTVRPRI